MEITAKLIKGKIVKLYHSLIVDVKLADGKIVPTFAAASMAEELYASGTEVYVSKRKSASAKIQYDLEMVKRPDGLVLVNPCYNEKLLEDAFNEGLIPDLAIYDSYRKIEKEEKLLHVNYEFSNSKGDKCYVAIENVYNKSAGYSVFPARINFFELEMFEEFTKLNGPNTRSMVFMIVPRMDCLEAKFSWNLDPVGAAKIYDAAKNGLEFVCYGCNIDKERISIADKMNILF